MVRYGVKSLQAQNRFTTTNPGSSIQRAWSEIRPVNDPNSKAIACNKPGAAAKLSASIAAGESIVVHCNSKSDGNPWPHAGGPITVYMAECKGDCSTWADPSEGEWFKIFQSGLLSGTIGKGKWGTNEMMEKGFKVETRIPASLKPGNYLIRHETIVSLPPPHVHDVQLLTPLVESGSCSRRILSRVCSAQGNWIRDRKSWERVPLQTSWGIQNFW